MIFLLDTKGQNVTRGSSKWREIAQAIQKNESGVIWNQKRSNQCSQFSVFTKYRWLDIFYENRVGDHFLPRTRNWLGDVLRSSSISMFLLQDFAQCLLVTNNWSMCQLCLCLWALSKAANKLLYPRKQIVTIILLSSHKKKKDYDSASILGFGTGSDGESEWFFLSVLWNVSPFCTDQWSECCVIEGHRSNSLRPCRKMKNESSLRDASLWTGSRHHPAMPMHMHGRS